MEFKWTKLTILACAALTLVSCGPKKQEEAAQPAKPTATATTVPSEEHPQHKLLTPEEQLKIDEDNVTEPFPG